MYHRPGVWSFGWDVVVGVVVLWAVWSATGAPTAVTASLSESRAHQSEPEPAPELELEGELKLATERPQRDDPRATAAPAAGDAAEGRRLQEAVDSCDEQTALERTVKVHAACCPDDEQCEGGWPHFCDSTCAPMFLDYYEKCHNVIQGQLLGGSEDPDFPAAAEWDRLRDSCIEVSVPPAARRPPPFLPFS